MAPGPGRGRPRLGGSRAAEAGRETQKPPGSAALASRSRLFLGWLREEGWRLPGAPKRASPLLRPKIAPGAPPGFCGSELPWREIWGETHLWGSLGPPRTREGRRIRPRERVLGTTLRLENCINIEYCHNLLQHITQGMEIISFKSGNPPPHPRWGYSLAPKHNKKHLTLPMLEGNLFF